MAYRIPGAVRLPPQCSMRVSVSIQVPGGARTATYTHKPSYMYVSDILGNRVAWTVGIAYSYQAVLLAVH